MKFHSFENFLLETENVKLDKELREYVLTHINEDRFQLKSKNFYKEFIVTPYKKETSESLTTAYNRLVKSIENLNVEDMYDSVIKAELLPYSYGNVFTSKFSLKIIPELSMSLEPEQLRVITT